MRSQRLPDAIEARKTTNHNKCRKELGRSPIARMAAVSKGSRRVAKFGWRTAWGIMMAELAPQSPEGAYVRPAPQKGSVNAPKLEDRDYVLYVGNACPWCHRTTIVRALRECQAMVKVVVMDDDPTRARRGGWSFTDAAPDPIWGAQDLKGVYDELELEGGARRLSSSRVMGPS